MLGIHAMQRDIVPSRRVCRSLFGPVDHDEVQKTLAREMDVLDSRQRNEWNFDFKNLVPLPGKYCWERVTPSDRVPVAYKVMLQHLDSEPSKDEILPVLEPETLEPELSRTTETTTQSTTTTTMCLPTTSSSQEQLENETTPPAKKPVSRKRKRSSGQTTITDFYQVKKLRKSEKVVDSH